MYILRARCLREAVLPVIERIWNRTVRRERYRRGVASGGAWRPLEPLEVRQMLTVQAFIDGPNVIDESSTYTLTLDSAVQGATFASWEINWGDGTQETFQQQLTSATHVYAEGPGTYVITAIATDSTGATSTASLALDTDFGSGQKVVTDLSDVDYGRGVAIQTDGKIVVVGHSGSDFALARYHADGSLDITFGDGGTVKTDFGGAEEAKAVAIQSDGMIVVAGHTEGNFAVARYTTAGLLDASFSSDGKVSASMGGVDFGKAVAIGSDGRIVVAGDSDGDFAVLRLMPNGSLDTSWDGDGKLKTDLGGTEEARGVAVDASDRIVVVGSTAGDFATLRYTAAGALDTSFSSDGKVIDSVGTTSDQGRNLAIQSDGKIVVVGERGGDFAITRYTSAGAVDTTFSEDGLQVTNFGSTDEAYSVAIQSDGTIVVAGRTGGDFAVARYLSNGEIDTAFSGNGKQTTDFGGTDYGQAVAIQADGKIVVAGKSDDDFALARYSTNGALDSTFGTDGRTVTDFGNTDAAWGVAVQSDGKIVAVGQSGSDFAVARYTTAGLLDSSFNADGKDAHSIGSADGARAVAIQSDGKIVVAGFSDGNFALVRYSANGLLDSSFDGDGVVVTDLGAADDEAWAVAIQGDGKIVAAGQSGGDFAIVRYNADGSLDTSFSGDGIRLTDVGSGTTDYGRGIAIQPHDGRIVVAGYSAGAFALVRYNTTGGHDANFDTDGRLTTSFPATAEARAVAIQSDGKIVAAGSSGTKFALARYGADGALDPSFNSTGTRTVTVGTSAAAHALAIQPDDHKIVLAGVSDGDFALLRFHETGLLDGSFNDSGRLMTPFNGVDQANAVALQADGRIVAAGSTDGDFALARYGYLSVNNVAPRLEDLAVTATIVEGGSATLSGTISDAPGDVLTLTIDWGDGSPVQTIPSAGPGDLPQVHTYADDGQYTVTVTVADDDGASTTGTATVTVTNAAPVIGSVAALPQAIVEGQAATLSGTFADLGTQDAFTITVDWGDGSLPEQFSAPAGTTSFSRNHTYADDAPGVDDLYLISVTVEDDHGGTATTSTSVAVTNAAPTISLTGADTVPEGTTYVLTLGPVTDPGADTVTEWIIDWGDGSPADSYLQQPTSPLEHNYSTGWITRTITVTLVDEDGTYEGASKTITAEIAAPTGLSATALPGGSVQLTWAENATNEDGYAIEGSDDDGVTWDTLAAVPAGTAGHVLTALSDGAALLFRVRAHNAATTSAYSNVAGTTSIPPAPSDVSIAGVRATGADLAWTDITGEQEYRVEYSSDGGQTFAPLGTALADAVGFSTEALSPLVTYLFRVQAFNAAGASPYSAHVQASTPALIPTAPTLLTASSVSSTRIDLAWVDESDAETEYEVQRSADGGATFTTLLTLPAGATAYSATELTINTSYQFRVRALGLGEPSGFTNTVTASTLPIHSPDGLRYTAVMAGSIDIAWDDNSDNESSFKVERSTDGVNFTFIKAVNSPGTMHTDTGLQPGTTYHYRVRAMNGAATSGYSNVATVQTAAAPGAPSALTATAMSNVRIDLAWTYGSNEASEFRIEGSTDGGVAFSSYAEVGADTTSVSVGSLTPGTTYHFRVLAISSDAVASLPSAPASAVTTMIAPAAPSSLTAVAVWNTGADLAWSDPDENETGFRVERSVDGGVTFASAGTTAAGVTSLRISDLTPGTGYVFRVIGFGAGGDSAPSDALTVTTTATVPAAPLDMAATVVSASQIDLSWFDGSTITDGFKLERSDDGGVTFTEVQFAAATRSHSVTGLTADTAYQFRLRAFNGAGDSPYTPVLQIETRAPVAPTGLTATTVASHWIRLDWMDASGNEAGFTIERSTDGGVTFTQVGTAPAGATGYDAVALTPSTPYHFRVRAHNVLGDSAYTAAATATTNPIGPASLMATTVSHTQIDLAWAAVLGADGYHIERYAAGGEWTQIGTTVGGASTSFQDTGIAAEGTYEYRVRAHNAGGTSEYGPTARAGTLLSAPSGLTATAATAAWSITLDWTDNSGESGFHVDRSTDGGTTFTRAATLGAGATRYIAVNLLPSTTYTFRVTAFNESAASAPSGLASATTGSDVTSPGTLTATASGPDAVTLDWTAVSGATGLLVERSVDGVAWTAVATPDPLATSVTLSGLPPGGAYQFRLTAYSVISSLHSTIATVTLPEEPLLDPANLVAAAASATTVNLAWLNRTRREHELLVEQSIDNATWTTVATVPGTTNSYLAGGLTDGQLYYFRVLPVIDGGQSGGGGSVSPPPGDSASVTPQPLPPGPTGLLAIPFRGDIAQLVWVDNISGETGFAIERLVGETWTPVKSVAAGTIYHNVRGLTPQTTYTFRIIAEGTSAPASNAATVETPAVPVAPVGLTAQLVAVSPPTLGPETGSDNSFGQVKLSWTDASLDEHGFRIERSLDGQTWEQIGMVAADVTEYSAGGLGGGPYWFRVRSYDRNSGASEPSNIISIVAPPRRPWFERVDFVSPTSLKVLFNSFYEYRVRGESGFRVEVRTANDDEPAGPWVAGGTAPAGAIEHVVTGLEPENRYEFRIQAFNAAGNSPWSVPGLSDWGNTWDNAPAAPSGLVAVVDGDGRVHLAWSDNSDVEYGYQIATRKGDGSWSDWYHIEERTQLRTGILSPETMYLFRVRAYNFLGESAYAAVGIETPKQYVERAIAAPALETIGSKLDVNGGKVRISDRSDYETSMVLEMSTDGATWSSVAVPGLDSAWGDFTVSGLQANTQYYFRAYAVNDYTGRQSGNSNIIALRTLQANTGAAAPGNLVVKRTADTQAELSWTDNSTNEVAFEIWYYAFDPDTGAEFAGGVHHVGAGTTAYVLSGLDPKLAYGIRVRAVDATERGFSTDYLDAYPVEMPTGVTATATAPSEITLSWTDNSPNETKFQVWQSLDGINFSVVDETAADQTSHVIKEVAPGATYLYRVIGVNAGGGRSDLGHLVRTRLIPRDGTALRTLPGFSTNQFRWSVDNTFGQINENVENHRTLAEVGFQFHFGGANYSSVCINEDGTVTFESSCEGTSSPSALNPVTTRMLAPFLGDVSRANLTSGEVVFGKDTIDGHNAFAVTWIDVGPSNSPEGVEPSNLFQLVLIDRSDRRPGDFDVEYNFERVGWDQTVELYRFDEPYAQRLTAKAFFSNGRGAVVELPGSGVAGGMLDANTDTGLIYNSRKSIVPGRYVFPVENKLEIDVDSYNDNGYDVPTDPTRSEAEDLVEDLEGLPGKIVPVSDDDLDGDGIPDFVDGYDRDGITDTTVGKLDDAPPTAVQGARFVPVVIEIPASFGLTNARLKLDYDASDPIADLTAPVEGSGWTIAKGKLRLWTADASTPRSGKSAFDPERPTEITGFYVPPTKGAHNAAETAPEYYDAAALATLGFTDSNRIITLWVEAVSASGGASPGDLQITIELDYDGDGPKGFEERDTIRLTAMSANLALDSDNTSAAAPEVDWREALVENAAGKPGKVILVNSADKDGNGTPDFADTGTNPAERFVPVFIDIPEWVKLDQAEFRLVYDGSDPAGATAEFPAPGLDGKPGTLRLWTKPTSSDPQTPLPPGARGTYLAPGTDYTAELLGLAMATPPDVQARRVELFLEAVRGSHSIGDQLIQLQIDPDGDHGPATFILADEARVTSISPVAPGAEHSGAVRLFDGSVAVAGADLSSNGFGTPWGHTRTWTNQLPYALAAGTNGNNVVVSEMPMLFQTGNGALVIQGASASYFDLNAEGTVYDARFGGLQQLHHHAAGAEFVLTDVDGGQFRFHGFGTYSGVAPGGAFKSYTSPAGVAVTASYVADKLSVVAQHDLSYNYHYIPEPDDANFGRLEGIELKHGSTSAQITMYTYYTDADAEGRLGDLNTAETSFGNALNTYVYAYYKEEQGGVPAGALKMVTGPDGFARAGRPADHTSSQLAAFADLALTYEGGRVRTQSVQGAGGSASASSAVGTFSYKYAPAAQAITAFNASSYITDEWAPDGTTNTTSANFAGQTVGDVLTAGSSSRSNAFTYDAEGRLTRADLFTGLGTVYKYYGDTDGALEGYLHTESIIDRNGTSHLYRTLTYEARTVTHPFGDVTIQAVDVQRLHDSGGDLTTDHGYTWGVGYHASQIAAVMPHGASTTTVLDAYGRVTSVTDGDGGVVSYSYHGFTGAVLTETISGVGMDQAMVTTFGDIDALGRPGNITDPSGLVTTYNYVDELWLLTINETTNAGTSRKTVVDRSSGETAIYASSPSGGLVQVGELTTDYAGRTITSSRLLGSDAFTTAYTYGALGRQLTMTDPLTMTTRYEYDGFGQVVAEYVGTDGNARYKLRSFAHDQFGNVTAITEFPGVGSNRVTSIGYDLRNRPNDVTAPDEQSVFRSFDNLGRTTVETQYDSDGDTLLHTVYTLDDLGRPTQTNTNGMVTVFDYDTRGNATYTRAASGLTTTAQYDAVGRPTYRSVRGGGGVSVLSETETTYGGAGPALVHTRDYYSNGPGSRSTYIRHIYDSVGRLTDTANGGMSDPGTTPSRTTALVTSYAYDSAGNVTLITDPRGISTDLEHDALGRLTARTDAFTGGGASTSANRKTRYEYDAMDHLVRQVEDVVGTSYFARETRYLYDGAQTGPAGINFHLLRGVMYPGTSGSASNSIMEEYTYNALGEVMTKLDANGVRHKYSRDGAGRMTQDAITSLPAGIDNKVTSLNTTYDAAGLPNALTSRGLRGNEVVRSYNAFGQVTSEIQEHQGDSDGSSAKVVYAYSSPATGSLLQSMTYPGGRVVSYDYDDAGRVTTVSDNIVGVLEEYAYVGEGKVVEKHRPTPGLTLTVGLDTFGRVNDQHWKLGTATVDRFKYEYDANSNKLVRENLVNAAFSEMFHRNGTAANSAYNNFNGFTYWQRGTLEGGSGGTHNAMQTTSRYQEWALDNQGNWMYFFDGTTGHTNALDARGLMVDPEYSYDPAGRLIDSELADTAQQDQEGKTRRVTYDAWGRAVKTEVFENGTRVSQAEYRYDALGRKIREMESYSISKPVTELYYDLSGNVIQENVFVLGTNAGTVHHRDHVWSPADGQLVLTDKRNFGGGSSAATTPGRLIFPLHDAEGSTTSVAAYFALPGEAAPSWQVVERYAYDPYGLVSYLDRDWSAVASTAFDVRYLYRGGRWFAGDQLYHFPSGSYEPALGPSAQLRPKQQQGQFGTLDWMQVAAGSLKNDLIDPLLNAPMAAAAAGKKFVTDPVGSVEAAVSAAVASWDRVNDETRLVMRRSLEQGNSGWFAMLQGVGYLTTSAWGGVKMMEFHFERDFLSMEQLSKVESWSRGFQGVATLALGAAGAKFGYNPGLRSFRPGGAGFQRLASARSLGRVTSEAAPSPGAALRAKYGHLSAAQRQALIAEKVEANAQRWLTNLQGQSVGFGKNGNVLTGHFLTRHSPLTTWFDQAVRANTGMINGELGRAVNASRFYRYTDMMHAVDRAMRSGQVGSVSIQFDHVVGGGFYRGSLRFAESSLVEVGIDRVTKLPYTAFPVLP